MAGISWVLAIRRVAGGPGYATQDWLVIIERNEVREVTVSNQMRVVLLLAAQLQGCMVGIGFQGTARTEGEWPTNLATEEGPILATTIVEEWGEPDEKMPMSETKERWVYQYGLRWNGPVVYVLIPLPLLIPVGHNTVTFLVEDGVAVSVDKVRQTDVHYVCGFIPGICPYFGCDKIRWSANYWW